MFVTAIEHRFKACYYEPNLHGSLPVSSEVTEGNPSRGTVNRDLSHEQIREELGRILRSEDFRASKRSQEFLTYVVEQTLNGSTDVLKERTIGIDVFHRSPGYDPGEDATVRVKAGEVRKRLGMYYSTHGVADPVRIDLPSGTYVPGFRRVLPRADVHEVESPTIPAEHVDPRPATSPVAIYRWLTVAAFVIAMASAALFWARARSDKSILAQFWAPVFRGDTPVSLCVAYVPVYGLDREPTSTAPPQLQEFVPIRDQFVGAGDLIASMRLSSMLTRERRPYALKVGNDVSFHDLRTGPAVLIGYSYTRWREISSQMRYFIDGSRRPVGITDNGAPTAWTLPDLPRDRKTDRDFAIISRVFHPDTHAILVELAGITSYGTDAAGDLVTNADLLSEVFRDPPEGWQHKNLQLVISVKVIGGTPASPKVVASYFW